ncbi:TlpA disulfide reductase family protein [Sphingobacterium paludis]|uniref:Peroxiredoxin n=1 Tax=Sphingobacterium paludis TaxID=1476465 RepID=A0A4R7D0E6_9SPHI|nr:TlpA disulfide reductase family protein [Sphingobacterium paludis]TDS12965.1 peroxiredoxin [Sphingobacterium paludis]
MKYKFLFTLSTALAATLCSYGQQQTALDLSGTVNNPRNGTIYLQRYDNKVYRLVDSAKIENGKFHFSSAVPLPELYALSTDVEATPLPVFLENTAIQVAIDGDANSPRLEVRGSKAQAHFEDFRENSRKLSAEEFIKQDPASIVAAYALFRNYSYSLSPEEIERHLDLLSPALHETQYVKILRDLVQKQRAVAIGKKAPDFVSKDTEGKEVRFLDHVGKGYVLLDFWAAWCPPCRKENPNVVAAFEQYSKQGFSVFGVSLDKKQSAWLKAIADDGLHWTQVSDLAFWDTAAAALYGVRFIPSNFLIAPDGTIVAKNIKGKELQQKLKEIYGAGSTSTGEYAGLGHERDGSLRK